MRTWDDFLGAYVEDTSQPAIMHRMARADGWQNNATGYGTDRDKSRAAHFRITGCDEIDPETCAFMLMKDDIAARIVEAPVEEMFRKGYELQVDAQATGGQPAAAPEDPTLASDFEEDAERLCLDEHVAEAMIWGRALGGAILYVNANDGQTPDKPLNEKNIQSIDSLIMFDRRYARPAKFYTDFLDPKLAGKFGKPQSYWLSYGVQANTAAALPEVHESRCIRFGGSRTDVATRWRHNSWDLSVLQRPYEKMKAFEQAFQAIGNSVSDFSQGVWQIQGLLNLIAAGQADKVGIRIAELDRNRSAARALILDKDHEAFTNVARSFASIPDVLDRFMMYLAGAVPMPVTKLFGRSAAGMNATGEGDFQDWYDTVSSMATKRGTPPLQRLYRLMSLAKQGPSGGVEKRFCVAWHPLKAMTDLERATLENTTATKDVAYINAGVLTPEEVALSRFGGDDWSAETDIDVDARKEAQESGVTFDPAPNDPEPEPPAIVAPGTDPNAKPPQADKPPPFGK